MNVTPELVRTLSLIISLFFWGKGLTGLYFSITYSGSKFELYDNIRGMTRTFKFGRSLLIAVCMTVMYFLY